MDLRHGEELQKRGPDARNMATGTMEQWLHSCKLEMRGAEQAPVGCPIEG